MRGALDEARKPIDLGNGCICASFGTDGSWLSLGRAHPRVGFVELNGLPPFDESRRGDPSYSRRYRLDMTLDAFAFLRVEVGGAAPTGLAVALTDPARPRWSGEDRGVRLRVAASADGREIRQAWEVVAMGSARPPIVVRLGGRLDRPALAEITELDPPPSTGARTQLRADGSVASVTAAEIDAEATFEADAEGATWHAGPDELVLRLPWPSDGSAILRFALAARMSGGPVETPPGTDAPAAAADPDDPLARRALAYVRGCTALLVDREDERVMLADHRILPLSWTRDAYWQALALLVADGPGDRRRVADHLRWLFRRCERPDGRWVRSHHADGRRKDRAFQTDQQLYPIIELTDYWRLTGELPEGVRWDAEVARAWAAAEAAIEPDSWLVATDETPADDPTPAPYLASTQLLARYAAERLAELAEAGALRLDPNRIRSTGTAVADAFARHFAAAGGPWPYAVGRSGPGVAYHDANDLPTALAPLWGLCAPDDPGWRATMRRAFSPENPAWSREAGGLGSVHTPGAWTLGDLQVWIVARAIGDEDGQRRAMERIHRAAYADGMLPEAYDLDGRWRIRTWFAWPGAALAALRVLDRHGRLEPALAVRRR